jgi:hypothetical protein
MNDYYQMSFYYGEVKNEIPEPAFKPKYCIAVLPTSSVVEYKPPKKPEPDSKDKTHKPPPSTLMTPQGMQQYDQRGHILPAGLRV